MEERAEANLWLWQPIFAENANVGVQDVFGYSEDGMPLSLYLEMCKAAELIEEKREDYRKQQQQEAEANARRQMRF